jgi:hypothetical protein
MWHVRYQRGWLGARLDDGAGAAPYAAGWDRR